MQTKLWKPEHSERICPQKEEDIKNSFVVCCKLAAYFFWCIGSHWASDFMAMLPFDFRVSFHRIKWLKSHLTFLTIKMALDNVNDKLQGHWTLWCKYEQWQLTIETKSMLPFCVLDQVGCKVTNQQYLVEGKLIE